VALLLQLLGQLGKANFALMDLQTHGVGVLGREKGPGLAENRQ
jgi:hypothetical protein